jgi:hypothetical protein
MSSTTGIRKELTMTRLKWLLAGVAFMAPSLGLTTVNANTQSVSTASYQPQACSTHVVAATSDVGTDPDLPPAVSKLLVEINKNPAFPSLSRRRS